MTDTMLQRVVFCSFGLSGLSALIYEVVWFRALSLVLGSTTYALSTMLATFMAGLSLGAYLGGIMADRAKRPVLLFGYMEAGIAALALTALPLINLLPPVYAWMYYTFRFSFEAFSASQFLLSSLVMLLPTILMGGTFPVVCRICYTGEGIGRETGAVYAINTIGAIAGSLLAGFVLIPYLGIRASNMAAASLNLAIAFICIAMTFRKGLWGLAVPAGLFLALIFLGKEAGTYPFNYYIAGRYGSYDAFYQEFGFAERLYERESSAGNIKVVRDVRGSSLLINNGKIESNNSGDLLNLAVLAYLPSAANPDARSFLNIGLGTGGTVYYASTIPTLMEIYSVEINPDVEEASRLFFYPAIFADPRIRFITADARNYLSMIKERYDIISSEPSYPVDQGFSHLYSREFFEIVKERLSDGGVFCQWVPRYIFAGDEFKMIVKTFQTVFPEVTVWRAKTGDFLLLGKRDAGIDIEGVIQGIRQRFDGAGLPSADFALISDSADVAERLKGYGGRINTDDSPIVEFIGARRMFERPGGPG